MRKQTSPQIAIFGELSSSEIATAHAKGEAALEELADTFKKLQFICSEFNQVELLSHMAMVALASQVDTSSSKNSLQAFELEIFQAVALTSGLKKDWDRHRIAEAIADAIELLGKNSKAFRETLLLNLSGNSQDNRVAAVLDRIRLTTQSVRGARHAFQTRAYLRELANNIDPQFEKLMGFSMSHFIHFFEDLAFKINSDLENLHFKHKRWMSANNSELCLQFFLDDNQSLSNHSLISDMRKLPEIEEMKLILFSIFEEQLRFVFKITPSEKISQSASASLWNILRKISFTFGDISTEKIQHLHLSNPVAKKPLVYDGFENYYLFCAPTAFANLIEIIDDLVADMSILTGAIERFKASWLETKLKTIISKAFPSGTCYSNAKWHDKADKQGETDCILVIDKSVGLFEAKSGKITAPAKRGAIERLKRQIGELLVEPSRQSSRFEKILESSTDAVSFSSSTGNVKIASSEVRQIFRINVLFDTIGPLSTNTRRLIKTGFIDDNEPMAPSMSIFELETLLDLLPDQISRIHYLRRRCELEENSLIEADEMDLIALYLENCFHIGELEFSELGFSIYGWSDKIAQMYDHEGRKPNVDFKLKRTKMWNQILETIEKVGEVGWTRFGYRLCETRYADQWTVQKLKAEMFRKANKVKIGQTAHTGVYSAEKDRLMPIALCVGKKVSEFGIFTHSKEAASSIMKLSNANEALVLFWEKTEPKLPYKYIATILRQPDSIC